MHKHMCDRFEISQICLCMFYHIIYISLIQKYSIIAELLQVIHEMKCLRVWQDCTFVCDLK